MADLGANYFFRGTTLRESLENFIRATGYPKHAFMDLIGDTDIQSDFHTWNERARRTRALVAFDQGYTFARAALVQSTKRTNLTQILAFEPFVTATSGASNIIPGDPVMDAIQFETGSLLDAINYSLINATLVTGLSLTAQQMGGAIYVLQSSPGGALTTGTTLSFAATNLSDLQDTLDNRGFTVTHIFADSTIKTRISGFTGSNTKFLDTEARKLIDLNAVVEGDFGVSQIEVERDLLTANGTYGMTSNATIPRHTILATDSRNWAKAWLRRPGVVRVPPAFDGVLAEVNAELTLRYDSVLAGQIFWNSQ